MATAKQLTTRLASNAKKLNAAIASIDKAQAALLVADSQKKKAVAADRVTRGIANAREALTDIETNTTALAAL